MPGVRGEAASEVEQVAEGDTRCGLAHTRTGDVPANPDQASFEEFLDKMRTQGLTAALQERDQPFGDYRTAT